MFYSMRKRKKHGFYFIFFVVYFFFFSERREPHEWPSDEKKKIPAGTHTYGLKKKDTHKKIQILFMYEYEKYIMKGVCIFAAKTRCCAFPLGLAFFSLKIITRFIHLFTLYV